MKEQPLLYYGRQWISDGDIEAVTNVLRNLNLTQGPKVAEFEAALAAASGAKYAVAVSSATAGLHIACLAAGIKKDDEVITSPITFVASANCAFYCDAKPVFSDVDPRTALMTPEDLDRRMTEKTRAVIPVHFSGQSANMEAISKSVRAAEKRYDSRIYIIEDAAHALGGRYQGKAIGSGQYSDMTVFSFHPVKHITTGEGGAVLTNDLKLYRRLQLFRSHGITRDADLLEDTSTQPWGYEQQELGYNYRLTDLQCALGISQLERLESFVQRRREIAARYRKAFADLPGIGMLYDHPESVNAYHLFVVLVDFARFGGRSALMEKLQKEHRIVTQVHYIPVHTQPYFRRRLGTRVGDFPGAEQYYRHCLSIPIFPAMTDADVEKVIRAVQSIAAR